MINPCCWRVGREAPGPADDETEDGLGWEPGPGALDTLAQQHGFITRLRARTHGPAAIRCHFRLEQSLSGRGKSLRKTFFDDTATLKKLIESTFFKAGTRMIALAVINIKGFLLS